MVSKENDCLPVLTGLRQVENHMVCGEYAFTVESNAFSPDRLSVWVSKHGYARAFYCFGMAKSAMEAELTYQLGDPTRRESYLKMFDSMVSGK